MKCPFCKAEDTQVIDSRVIRDGVSIRRRRACSVCEKRFTTYEYIELSLPSVIKQDGKREDFIRDKLLHSFSRALHKRPVPIEYIDQAIEEINSRDIGEEVMRALKKLDKVAYIRFASVYKSFSDPEDFNVVIKDLG
jgi:transcriptional repressor NrdR